MTSFFVLEPEEGISFGRKWAYADQIDPVNRGEFQTCPVCGGPVSGLKWLPPHRIKLSNAKPEKWGDFVWGAGFPLLVSGRFKIIYEKEDLRGIASFSPPVEIVRVGNRKAGDFPDGTPEYHLIDVPWGGADQDDAASGVILSEPERVRCSYCRVGGNQLKQDRIVIKEGSWDGSDIFKAIASPAQFMVSENFKQVSEDYSFKNIWLIPSENYAYDLHKWGLWYVNK